MQNKFHWCGLCRFPGKEQFILGTVQAATELEAERALVALADELFPSLPKIESVAKGLLVFQEEP